MMCAFAYVLALGVDLKGRRRSNGYDGSFSKFKNEILLRTEMLVAPMQTISINA